MAQEQAQDAMITLSFLGHLRELNSERAAGSFPALSEWGPGEWLASLIGEYGEAANEVKKLHRLACGYHNFEPRSSELDLAVAEREAALVREYADIMIYLDLYANSRGFDLPVPQQTHLDWARSRMETSTSELAYWQYGLADVCGLTMVHAEQVDMDHMARLIAFLIVAAEHRGYDLAGCIKIKFDETSRKIGSPITFFKRRD